MGERALRTMLMLLRRLLCRLAARLIFDVQGHGLAIR